MQRRACLGLLLQGAALAFAHPALAATGLSVAAAESFRKPLTALAERYRKEGGEAVSFVFGASSMLAEKVAGGGIDLVFCARSWADRMAKDDKLQDGTRADFLGDHLVLIAPAPHAPVALDPAALVQALKGGKLALAEPGKTQTGDYAKSALVSLGLWDGVAGSLLPGENVRAAVASVRDGHAPLGIAYQTDVHGLGAVAVVAAFPDSSHPPIAYSLALTRGADPAAAKFLSFLQSAQARAAYVEAGFALTGSR